MAVKIAGTLPEDEHNGLEAVADDLIDNPNTEHVVVAVVDCRKVTTDYANGEVTPTARIRRIEVIDSDERKALVLRLLGRVFARRTGWEALPLDVGDGEDVA